MSLDGVGEILRGFEPRAPICDEVGHEGHILFALGNGLGARYGSSGLHAGETAEPGELSVVVLEGGHGGGTDLHKWPDVGHWPSIEVPDRVAKAILDRLEG